MGERRRRPDRDEESFRVPQSPIILGEPPHSRFDAITPEAIATETRRLFDEKGVDELMLGLRPDLLGELAHHVSHMGLRFDKVVASIINGQLHLSGNIKKGPITLLRQGQLVVANGELGLVIIDGTLGPLTKLVAGDFNRMITEPMSTFLGSAFAVGGVRIEQDVVSARVTKKPPMQRRKAA